MHRMVDNSYRFSFLSWCVCVWFFFGGGVTFSFCSTQALHIELRHVILLIQTLNNMGVGGWEWGLQGARLPQVLLPPLICASIHVYMYLGSMWKYYTVNIKKQVLYGTLPPLPTPEYLENLRFFFFFFFFAYQYFEYVWPSPTFRYTYLVSITKIKPFYEKKTTKHIRNIDFI